MMLKILAIAFLFIAPVVWAGDLTPAQINDIEQKLKQASEKWQNDLKYGSVGRFQAVSIGQGGVIILDTKEGLVWVAGATANTGPKIVYMGQVNPYTKAEK